MWIEKYDWIVLITKEVRNLQIDWGILGVILTVFFGIIGFISVSKKNTIIIKPKNKNGGNDFSHTKISNEEHNYKD